MHSQSYYTTNVNMRFLYTDFWAGFISAAAGWAVSFVMPVLPFLIFAVILVLADLFSGLWAAKKRKEKIHSTGLRRTVEKLVFYFIAILLSEGMKTVFMPHVPVTYIVAFAIALTEFQSNIENIETITGVHIWKFVKQRLLAVLLPAAAPAEEEPKAEEEGDEMAGTDNII